MIIKVGDLSPWAQYEFMPAQTGLVFQNETRAGVGTCFVEKGHYLSVFNFNNIAVL